MRMDEDFFLSAYDLINNLSEVELGNIFRKFGEERYHRIIARAVVQARKDLPISTTTQLANIIIRALGSKAHNSRIHPAARIFQALRIAVNRELEVLEASCVKAIDLLNRGGIIGIISFHSLEDRIVKNVFREYACRGLLNIVTKKPLIPSEPEEHENRASRSAKLRVAQKK
ncbi:MAG: 16S rRNA (cytosine(1402)-N(4))-methyltransferase RsmH, partial [Candidatus Omnitrophota bacterium]